MKNKFIIGIFLSVFLLISPKVNAANFKDNQTVDSNKMWTIEFTSKVGFDDITKQGITITDSKGNIIPVGLQLGQDEKTILVAAPQGGYKAGESYTLNISSKIHSNKGTVLNNQYKVNFNIKSTNCIVTFKDKNLEKAIRDSINKPTGDIFKSDVQKIANLDIESKGVQDISGIENLTNLKMFHSNNRISDISPLKDLTNLKHLFLTNGKISDVSPLKNLSNLQELNLTNNKISDISSLESLTNLKTLILIDNYISDISGLKELINLENLRLGDGMGGNNISDLNPISNLKKLKILWLIRNKVSDITPLKELKNLRELYLEGNPITDYSPASSYYSNLENNDFKLEVSSNDDNVIVFKDKNLEKEIRAKTNKATGDIYKNDVEKITFLDLSNKWIHDINGIENLTNLGYISLINNPITDISLLKELTNLTAIQLAGTKVNDINALKGLTKLEFVNLGGNVSDYGIPVTDISALTGLNNLSNLYLSNTPVTDITPLKNSTKLRYLFLDGTQVTDISALKKLTNLEVLYLKNTKITDTDKQLLKNILTKCNVAL